MKNGCRVMPKNNRCAPEVITPERPVCERFEVCLPFGRRIAFDGNCFRLSGNPNIMDGWYSEFQVVDGCIINARESEIPVYTPPPCAPAAGPCDDDGGGGATLPPLSPDAANLLYYTTGQLMAQLVVGTTTGITITGTGTRNDPLNFSVTAGADAQTFITSGSPSVIDITGTGELADPYIITVKDSPLGAGAYGPFTIDSAGRVTGYDDTAGGNAITQILDGSGTTATPVGEESGIMRIDLTTFTQVNGAYTLGGYTVTVDETGRVTKQERNITLTADTYRLGGYDVTLNELGSVTNIEEVPPEDSAIPGTFVAQFPGAAGSVDTDRIMTFDLPFSGLIHVEYCGYLGNAAGTNPGVSMQASGLSITIDDVALPSLMVTTALTMTAGTLARTGVRATTLGPVAAGPHTLVISGPAALTQNDGFIRCEIVGRGG